MQQKTQTTHLIGVVFDRKPSVDFWSHGGVVFAWWKKRGRKPMKIIKMLGNIIKTEQC